ncbi:MAG TPA: tRNA uridine-5-carboxymethylaminomethyl(34) synthesis GTPase MnmE, partial [Thermomicrobiaceae bacterium]|nr:tRNA uridine-5-carboxymethylaminomethyl(34) synthesis GTPase MnmE [Thermomicrobiaceae bacterium]
MYDDTISAIATPLGDGGIGVIRVSGPEANVVASRIFRRGRKRRPVDVAALCSHRLYFGYVVDPDTEQPVDEVMLARMAAPHSYTREDVVEISCHGGPLPVREILRLTLRHGARQANPGEFTLRAFVNGRIDLSQAEAVMGVVSARTSESLRLAVDELRGRLTSRLAPARDALIDALAYLDASADFPEDEVPPLDLEPTLRRAEAELSDVVRSGKLGLLYREGAQIAIVGRPNVGKSSLLNALLRADRAIVTEIAGTTRDVIAETITLRGIPATLLDTAGIGDTADVVERIGIDRSRQAIARAGIAILVLDGSQPATPDDLQVARLLRERFTDEGVAAGSSGRLVVAINKRDLPARDEHQAIRALFSDAPVIELSSRSLAGIERLEEQLYEMLASTAGESMEPALVNLRQQQALSDALDGVRSARIALDSRIPHDLIAVDVRDALSRLGEITGEQISETILDEIFSRFCIG